MYDDWRESFVPIRNKRGKVTGVMDRATADYLASQASGPTQASLDALLAGVTRIRVVPLANFTQAAAKRQTLLDTSDPVSIAAFQRCFAIVEDPDTFGHCMCPGDPHIE